MKVERNKLLSVLSEALDNVEKEIFGVTGHHGKRVAWLCVQMGEQMEMSQEELSDLAVSALLHDNALSEYQDEYENGSLKPGISGKNHCRVGEKHLQMIPGCHSLRGFVLYHHECADGSGPFHKKANETPLGAQLVHIADEVDLRFALGTCALSDVEKIREYVRAKEGTLFGTEAVNCFLDIFSEECLEVLADNTIEQCELEIAPVWIPMEAGGKANIYTIAGLFAEIIDYKSSFTSRHSMGLAQKAEKMAQYYEYDEQTTAQLYLAGALHDIGKLLVRLDILEKPDRLEKEEYRHIQSHAYETWRLLSKVPGLETVTAWAANHHEKLNGTGYPFGKRAEELGEKERLMACLDIYQALTEERPYKAGMPHAKVICILREMAEKQELDAKIVEDIAVALQSDAGMVQKTEIEKAVETKTAK